MKFLNVRILILDSNRKYFIFARPTLNGLTLHMYVLLCLIMLISITIAVKYRDRFPTLSATGLYYYSVIFRIHKHLGKQTSFYLSNNKHFKIMHIATCKHSLY